MYSERKALRFTARARIASLDSVEELRKNGLGFTAKSLIIGVLLIPVNCYWVVNGESVYNSYSPSGISLFSNVVFTIFMCVFY